MTHAIDMQQPDPVANANPDLSAALKSFEAFTFAEQLPFLLFALRDGLTEHGLRQALQRSSGDLGLTPSNGKLLTDSRDLSLPVRQPQAQPAPEQSAGDELRKLAVATLQFVDDADVVDATRKHRRPSRSNMRAGRSDWVATPPVLNLRNPSIAIMMMVVFCVSFTLFWWERKTEALTFSTPQFLPIAEADLPPPATVTPVTQPVPPPPAVEVVRERASAPVNPVAANAPPPSNDATPSDEAPARPLPIYFRIRNLRDLSRIEGEIRNNSSSPLSIILRAVNANTQATTELSLDIAPGETKPYSTDDGLVMNTNDRLIVHSPPFQDRVLRVP
ncbi:MAG: hypothetical protein ACLPTF_12950 [Steroidobacteraceae bacterium]